MQQKNEFEIENQASVELDENKNFLTLAPQNSIKALEKVQAITKVIDGAVRLALQRTSAQDWISMGGKWYLQASGVEKIRGVFGLYFRDRQSIKEDFPDGSYAYICSGVAGSKLLDSLYGETTIEIEGCRSSKDGFFSSSNKEPDAMDVRKSAYANFQVRAAKALLGFGNYSSQDLINMGVKVNESPKVEYSKGSQGGSVVEGTDKEIQVKLYNIIVKLTGSADEGGMSKMLLTLTEFVGKDGKKVPGVPSLKSLTGKRLAVTYGKAQKMLEEQGEVITDEIRTPGQEG